MSVTAFIFEYSNNAFRSSLVVEGGSYTSNKSDNNGGALFIRGTGEEAQKAVDDILAKLV